MKIRNILALALVALAFAACDDTTDTIGKSLTPDNDGLNIAADSFVVATRSVAVDSVVSRNTQGYLGKVKDPETGSYVTGSYMTQFHLLEDYTPFASEKSIVSRENGEVVADSCELVVYVNSFYGDSLASMKMKAMEMDHPMLENRIYYSTFDPEKEGYVRKDGIQKEKVYSIVDFTKDESTRYNNMRSIPIQLNDPYTDKNGKTYKNYGTYIMQTYYAHPEYFSTPIKFIKNVIPGFYMKYESGLGSMAYVKFNRLFIYYRYKPESRDTVYTGYASFSGNEEVLQTSTITNDEATINRLVNDNSCSYVKSPSGIFTELTMPVDDIYRKHEQDSLNTVQLILQRINNTSTSQYALSAPTTLLILPVDSAKAFFENDKVIDNKTSFIATYSSTSNTYTFSNISGLIRAMRQNEGKSANWNKAYVIPVTTSYTTLSSYTTQLTSIVNDMSLSSTRLVGGSGTTHDVKVNVIYSKFK